MSVVAETPASRGFSLPPEWAPHDRCWMAWPCRTELWGSELGVAADAYAAVARAIARFEPVTMIAPPDRAEDARANCGPEVAVEVLPLDDSWMRDTGPTFLCNGEGAVAGVSWRFNAWGEKYTTFAEDAALAGRLLGRLDMARFDAPFVLEGGAFHGDGEGTLIATESVLLNANRRGPGTRAAMEEYLAGWLGIRKVIWLPAGLAGDETDGHVDNVACFTGPGEVLALVTPTPDDPNHEVLQRNLAILTAETDAAGRPLRVTAIEQPTLHDATGCPLAASYINFYVANGGIVMPKFSIDQDDRAASTVQAAYPGRTLVQIDARAIVRGGGGIHCITQQQPAATCEM